MKSLPAFLWSGVAILAGCACLDKLAVRSQSPDEPESTGSKVRLVGDLAVPFGMYPVKIEAVGLVTGLQGTGSDPLPSPQRAALLAEMQTRGVTKPNRVLASKDTALVLVRGVLRPGIQKGDLFDVEVRIPSRSETTSLRGGRLLKTPLKELAVLNNQIHEGSPLGSAEGPIMVDPSADEKNNRVLLGRGRILGGGVARKSRPLALVLKKDHRSVLNSSRIANAVNKRFHVFDRGIKTGVAKARTDEYIELAVHPRYADNIQRYVRVIRMLAMRESEVERAQRLTLLKEQSRDPITAGAAALALEAIGHQGIDVLKEGMVAKDPEIRFYSAEALAYLDQREAAEPLAEAARNQPAFRVFALTALSAMDDYSAYEELRGLLEANSVETRYGAFRALWAMNAKDPLVLGEQLGGQFNYHVLNTGGPPLIHVTRSRRPEILIFGGDQRLSSPLSVNAGTRIMLTDFSRDQIAVAKYTVDEPDQKRIVSNRVDDVVRAIVELGGTYPDVVQALQEAKQTGALTSRFEIDALPEAGRKYRRLASSEAGTQDGTSESGDNPVRRAGGIQPDSSNMNRSDFAATSPLPELFQNPGEGLFKRDGGTSKSKKEDTDSGKKSNPLKGFFARMVGSNPK